MKTILRLPFVVLATSFLIISASAQAQKSPANPPRYKDVVVDNPTAEADMKVVGDFVNALVSGELDKAKTLASPAYVGRGPAPSDSANIEQMITNWKENYKTQMDRKVSFVTQTFRVLSGSLMGNWVSLWGDYTFKEAGKTISFPFQYTARVANGKVMGDRIYYDRMFILTQLGFKITPPEVAQK